MLETLNLVVLLAVVGAAAWSDVRTKRIPNVLAVTGLACGLLLAAASGELASSATAAGAAFALGFLLFATGVLGGGDVKLLIAAAALLGLPRFGVALVLTALAGAALAIFVAARRGVLLPVLMNSKDTLASWATPGRAAAGRAAATSGVGIPYAVAIAVGAAGAWFM